MSGRLPWTKLQDFYLRLGFLKVLVACLSWERRSATTDSIVRRLERPLFESVGSRSDFKQVVETIVESMKKRPKPPSAESIGVAEALVSDPRVPSALYAITRDTAYKMVDWGRDAGFLTRANQISERALLLQGLLPQTNVSKFLSGDPTAWNPFVLTLRERLFFLYHALERDLVTVDLIEVLAAASEEEVIEARLASQMTCGALFRMLEASERVSDAESIREYRTALDLALTMADEVGAAVPPRWARQALQARSVRETKAALRKSSIKSAPVRKTTKNADHQTIPRFEQLVDLGFLRKPEADNVDPVANLAARRRWRYVPTDACRRWSQALRTGESVSSTAKFRHSGFATVAVAAFAPHSKSIPSAPPRTEESGRRIWEAYSAVGRSVGFSPVDSIALRATLDAVAEGVAFEMDDTHRLLLAIKERGVLSDCVQFAAGTTLDTMFVRLKPSFMEQFNAAAPQVIGE